MKKLTLFCLLILSPFSYLNCYASDVDSFIAQTKQVKSFDAQFKQTSKDSQGRVLQTISGILKVKKPSKLNWRTNPPYEQLVVSDGKLVWVYDMDLEQVSIRKLDNRVQETPALLLSGSSEDIKKHFKVKLKAVKKQKTYSLTPKDESQLYSRIEFVYQGERLDKMVIFDAAGQITSIEFSKQKLNNPIADKEFEFIVPEGVDVIDARNDH